MTRSKKNQLIISGLIIIAFVLSLTGSILAAPSSPVSNERVDVIVAFDHAPDKADHQLFTGLGGQVKHSYQVIPAIAGSLPQQAIEALQRNPHVKLIELDHTVQALEYVATDELANSWGVQHIHAGDVHDTGNLGGTIKVAVLDSGVAYTHQDLYDNFVVDELGYDFVQMDDNPMDVYGHGTHVAGTIAAESDGWGVVGVAPKAQIIALRILDDNGYGTTSRTIAALNWIFDYNGHPELNGDPIRVTNNSYGGPTYSELEEDAFKNVAASGSGVLHIAAAGNSGKKSISIDNVSYPAKYSSVIAVAATDKLDARASFSSTGPAVELAAPGVSVLSTWMRSTSYLDPQPFAFADGEDYYKEGSGTSMAAPHVAGTAALVWAAKPGLTCDKVREILNKTATDLGTLGPDYAFGNGLVDAAAAIADAVSDAVDPTPVSTIKVAELTGSATWLNAATWQATCTVQVDPARSGAVISGTWSNGSAVSAVTDSTGKAVFQINMSKKVSVISFIVGSIALDGYGYDSSGPTEVTIDKPLDF